MKRSLRVPCSAVRGRATVLVCSAFLLAGMASPSGPAKAAGPDFVLAWGAPGTGPGEFDRPSGIVRDPSGDLYVTDTNNHRVQRFSANGEYRGAWAGGGASATSFSPRGIALDGHGRVFVVDGQAGDIQVFTTSGAFLAEWGGAAGLRDPWGIAVDGLRGFVFVADTGNDRIVEFTTDGAFIRAWGAAGSGPGEFSHPRGIAIDAHPYVFVSDSGNGRFQVFTIAGTYLFSWGTPGSGVGQFDQPTGFALNQFGDIVIVADAFNDRIQELSQSGRYGNAWGGPGSGPGQFNRPTDLAADWQGGVYVVDSMNDRVQKFVWAVVPTVVETWGALKARYH